MIHIPNRPLSLAAGATLQGYQNTIDAEADYADRVRLGKKQFKQKNRKSNGTFKEVRAKLSEMCSGARRCMYCEDSVADEVEHYLPKDLYPEAVFLWNNYLYSCGPCNGPKESNFAIFDPNGAMVSITRKRKAPIVPPMAGNPVLLAPRNENALDFMVLDIAGDTFLFVPTSTNGLLLRQRAKYTIDLLGLNLRDYLPKARREAYTSYLAIANEYVRKRDNGAPQGILDRVENTIRVMHHPTVWREMRRQRGGIPELSDLFNRAPEALGW
jgi:hypothetical protein